MEQDIGKALTYQIKREIAERYFSYRKIIEEDKQALEAMINDLRFLYEQKIGKDLARIYVLLKDPELIKEFMNILDWEDLPFFDPYTAEHESTRKEQVFKDIKPHGWLAHSKFNNLLLESYKRLYLDTLNYREKLDEVKEEAQVIEEEINQFKEKFSIEEIINFLKTLDRRDDLVSVLGENLPLCSGGGSYSNLELGPVDDVEKLLPKVPELPQPNNIKNNLKALSHKVTKSHKEKVLKNVSD